MIQPRTVSAVFAFASILTFLPCESRAATVVEVLESLHEGNFARNSKNRTDALTLIKMELAASRVQFSEDSNRTLTIFPVQGLTFLNNLAFRLNSRLPGLTLKVNMEKLIDAGAAYDSDISTIWLPIELWTAPRVGLAMLIHEIHHAVFDFRRRQGKANALDGTMKLGSELQTLEEIFTYALEARQYATMLRQDSRWPLTLSEKKKATKRLNTVLEIITDFSQGISRHAEETLRLLPSNQGVTLEYERAQDPQRDPDDTLPLWLLITSHLDSRPDDSLQHWIVDPAVEGATLTPRELAVIRLRNVIEISTQAFTLANASQKQLKKDESLGLKLVSTLISAIRCHQLLNSFTRGPQSENTERTDRNPTDQNGFEYPHE